MGALSLRLYHHARGATPRATCARFPPSMATGFPIPGGAIAAHAFRPRFLLHPLGAERIIRHSLKRGKTEAHTMRRWTWIALVAAMTASFLPPPVAAQS